MSAGKRKKITTKILHLRPSRLLQYDFTLGALKSHRYIGNIVISDFYPIRFTVTFAGAQHIYRYTRDIVISRIVVLGFHSSKVIKKKK